jgi:MFS family permease
VPEVSADVALGEAIAPAVLAQERVVGRRWPMIVYPAVGFAVGNVGGTLIGTILVGISRSAELAQSIWLIGAIVGALVGFRVAARRHLRDFLGGLRRLGSPEHFPTSFRITDQAFEIESERQVLRIAWPAILFLLPAKEHWLLQADSMTIAIPRRAFDDVAAERAFVAALREKLSPRAQEQSA